MPQKIIYVPPEDVELWEKAAALPGYRSLSELVSELLRKKLRAGPRVRVRRNRLGRPPKTEHKQASH